MNMQATTLPHWLTTRADLTPNSRALEFVDGTTITFLELKKRSETFAKQLAHLGVERDKRVAILSNNHIDMIIEVHALNYLGAVAVMLKTKQKRDKHTYQLTTSHAFLLLTTESLQNDKALPFNNTLTFTEVAGRKLANTSLLEEISLQDPCTMMFTSGTTGKPKAVLHTYGNHWWSATGSALNLGLEKDDKWLLPLPIFQDRKSVV